MISRYLFILMAVIATSSDPQDLGKDLSRNGTIVLSDEGQQNGLYALNGFWEFYPNEHISSSEIKSRTTRSFIEVPSWWTVENGVAEIQSATYRLQVILPKRDRSSSLALTMPDVYCSYTLWMNGTKLGQNGVVGKTKKESKPQWKPETYTFNSERDTLEIILHLSNFYHHRTGISKPILLGQADTLIQRKRRIETSNTILLFGLTILVAAAGIIYVRLKSVALLFYILLCVSWILRSAFSNHYQIAQWFPEINWYLLVRTEYISLYLSTLFGSLLVGSLFPRDVNRIFRMFFLITCICFTIFTLIAPPSVFTTFVQLYLGLSSILLTYILVIIIKAYTESREGAGFLLITALLAVGIFGYVILSYQGVFELDELIFNVGFLTQFIITLITVIRRIYKMKAGNDYDFMTFDEATKLK